MNILSQIVLLILAIFAVLPALDAKTVSYSFIGNIEELKRNTQLREICRDPSHSFYDFFKSFCVDVFGGNGNPDKTIATRKPVYIPAKPITRKPVKPSRPIPTRTVRPVKPTPIKPVKPTPIKPVKPTPIKPVKPAPVRPVKPTVTTNTQSNGNKCSTGGLMTEDVRKAITESVNKRRSGIALGTDRSLSQGKNIHKLIYDCDLEKTAQEWANKCTTKASTARFRKQAGVNQLFTGYSGREPSVLSEFEKAFENWWSTMNRIGRRNDYTYGRHFSFAQPGSQMAWAKTTKIGCGISKCKYPYDKSWDGFAIICHFKEYGNKENHKIYEIGSGCRSNSDCTTFSGSKCESSTGLCIAPANAVYERPDIPNPSTFSLPTCSGTSYMMTNEARKIAVDLHNEHRASLTLGTVENGKRAKNIYELKYNCELERSSQQWADRCEFEHSGLKGVGENLYRSYTKDQSIEDAISESADKWWDELVEIGVQTPDYGFSGSGKGLGHWTQMAWDRTTEVGCAAQKCGSGSSEGVLVVCQYKEQGNFLGEKIYEFGKGCEKPSDCTLFPKSTCVTRTRLCKKP